MAQRWKMMQGTMGTREDAPARRRGPVTEKGQMAGDLKRDEFLAGVIDEAAAENYDPHAAGRLVVLALRAWEGR